MPKIGQKQYELLLNNASVDGAGTITAKVYDHRFTVKAWATDFGGGQIQVQIKSETGTWIPAYTFSSNGVQFGEVGDNEEEFRAVLIGSTGASGVYCSITQ